MKGLTGCRAKVAVLGLLGLLMFPALGAQPRTLDFKEALGLAKTNSSPVRAGAAQAEAAHRAVWNAASAWLPRIEASASGAWLANPPAGMSIPAGSIPVVMYNPTTGGALIDPVTSKYFIAPFPPVDLSLVPDAKSTYFKGTVTFSQPLLVWGKIAAGVALASLEAELAEVKKEGSALDAVRLAARSYDAALLARDSAALLGELRDLAAAIADDRSKALEAGDTTRVEVLSADADLAALEAKRSEALEAEKSALAGLAFATGLGSKELTAGLLLSSPLRDKLPVLDAAALLEAAPAASTDRGVARTRLSQAGRKLDLERGKSALLPDLALFANLEASGQNPPFTTKDWMDTTWSWDLTVGLNIKAELFDGGASLARIGEAGADLLAAKAGLEAAEEGARLEMVRALAAARNAETSLAAKRAKAAWAAEVKRNAAASAAGELISRADLNGAAILETSARLELLQATWILAEALADLERLAGRGLE